MSALTVWTEQSGYTVGTYQERVMLNLALPVANDTGVVYSIISGALPPGLRLESNYIVGTAYEVARPTTFTFCIRAIEDGVGFSDRTLNIIIEGSDAPEFITAEGNLPVGDHEQFFVLDQSFVDFQIEAFDYDTAVGQKLTFFIAENDGELPPGLRLTQDGRLVGFVEPAISIRPEDGDGTYDNSYYDAVAFDFAYRPSNGYDSYTYDHVFYDFNTASQGPRKLNRNYEFIVSITDGDVTPETIVTASGSGDTLVYTTTYVAKRKFKIFVVGDDYFRADNTTWLNGSGLFTADGTYLNAPIWLTPSDLGLYRANNYLTIPLEVYDNMNVRFGLTAGTLPPGVSFDENNNELYGSVPYQPAITKLYTFTITATKISDKGEEASTPRTFTLRLIGEIDSVITWNTNPELGSINANFISTLNISASSTIPDASVLYRVTQGTLPPGLSLNLDGEIVGKVNQYPTVSTLGLTTFSEYSGSTKGTGTVTISNQSFDNGTTTVDRVFSFTIEARDQYGYSATTRQFTITVDTPNQLVYSNLRVKPFLKIDPTIELPDGSKISQRSLWKDFINDTNIFTPNSIYRPNDPSFGLQAELSMLIYAGIETTEAARYISAMGLNHKRKRFQFGSVNKATAYITGTNTAVYEVVYVSMVDPLEPNGKRLPNQLNQLGEQTNTITVDSSNIFWTNDKDKLAIPAPTSDRPEPIISIDSTGYRISNSNPDTYFPNSISNWRDRLKKWSDTDVLTQEVRTFESERNYLPLWMRSIQPGTKAELGFQLAVPLCYCKVGAADDIILNIKNHINTTTFKFNKLDYTADRYIIDSVEGESGDKYLVFRNDRITV